MSIRITAANFLLFTLVGCAVTAAPKIVPTAAALPATPIVLYTSTAVDTPVTLSSSTPTTQVMTPTPVLTPTPAPTSGPTATPGPDDWKLAPVVPTSISKRVRLIYEMGLMKGNNPRAYSKVGDCNMTLPAFAGDFDTPGAYDLGAYGSLQETIEFFTGSHGRKSLAAKDGLTSHAVLSMLWVDWKECTSYETPLTCEYRIQKPMFALISFGTNDANGNVEFDKAMRRVLDMTIGNGTIPILATKADNAEGDNSINRTIYQLALEYELPLWNYWAAVQPLPNHGLNPERIEHLSEGPHGFTSFADDSLQFGWPVRNLTALQVLDVLRKGLESNE